MVFQEGKELSIDADIEAPQDQLNLKSEQQIPEKVPLLETSVEMNCAIER